MRTGNQIVYQPAHFVFDRLRARFDGSQQCVWTDLMMHAVYLCCTLALIRRTHPLARLSAAHMLLTSFSALCGAAGHARCGADTPDGYDDALVAHLSSSAFRLNWSLTSGLLTLAAAPLGCMGSVFARAHKALIVVPDWVWYAYGVCTTVLVAAGAFSFQRPAADVLFAGMVQAPPTVYLLLAVLASRHSGSGSDRLITWTARHWCLPALLLAPAPILLMYPLILHHPLFAAWSLGDLNAFLHVFVQTVLVGQVVGVCAFTEHTV